MAMKQQGTKRKRHIGIKAAVAILAAVLVVAAYVFLYGGLPGDLWYGGSDGAADGAGNGAAYSDEAETGEAGSGTDSTENDGTAADGEESSGNDSSSATATGTGKAVDQQTLFRRYQQNEARSRLVKTAAAQIGNFNGRKFWSWYGFESRVEWCACYVSWCADQCGYIDKGIIPKFAGVVDGAGWFADRAQWRGRGYQPLPGDIIFFDWQGDGTCDHVGIVEKCDGERVRTIEGNSWNMCRRKSYPVGSGVIYGYGVPKL